jgi:hypothetical protein
MSADGPPVVHIVVAVVVFVMLLSGPGSGLDFARDSASLGDGTASVTVVQPTDDQVRVTEGRFGTNVSYLRIPDLVVDVTALDGRPRVLYQVTVPELGIQKQNDDIVRSTGRMRVSISDRALPPGTDAGGTTARLVVRVQSFTGQSVVMNRTVDVRRG